MSESQVKVSIIDDDHEDVFAIKRALSKENAAIHVQHLRDGFEAKKYFSEPASQGAPEKKGPEVVLLDINMPGMNGFEVLEHLKTSKTSKHLPVIMLTTSSNSEDVEKAYALGANAFMVKPDSLTGMKSLVETFEAFWLSTAKLPD